MREPGQEDGSQSRGEIHSVPAKRWFGRQDPRLVHMAAKALFWIQGGVTQARMTPGHAKKPFYFKKDDFGLPMRTPHPICAHMCSSTLHLDAKIQFFRFFRQFTTPWSPLTRAMVCFRTIHFRAPDAWLHFCRSHEALVKCFLFVCRWF